MKLSDLFTALSYGELRQLYIGNNGQGIRPEDYPQVIFQLNAGLALLHSRFPLLEKQVIVQQLENIATYYLRTEFLVSNKQSTQKYKYLIDSVEHPFTQDIIRVESVYDECGCPLFLNDEPQCNSIMCPSFDSIQVIAPIESNALFVTYRANHPIIPTDTTDLDIEIRIPVSHQKALTYFIASQFYSNSPNQETSAKGIEWTQRYETECKRIEDLDLNNQYIGQTNTKPERMGWV